MTSRGCSVADCVICQIVRNEAPSKKVYEDDEIVAFLDFNGASRGHTFVVPKQHFPIIEQLPDTVVSKLFTISNKVSTALFESMGVQGTNIFVANGVSAGQSVAHVVVNVIPRREGDSINLQWKPKQLSEEEMATVELKIKESAKNLGYTPEKESPKKDQGERMSVDREDYLWKSMNRRAA